MHLQRAQMLWLKLVLNITKHCWSLAHTTWTKSLMIKVILESPPTKYFSVALPSPKRTTLKLCPAILLCCYVHSNVVVVIPNSFFCDLIKCLVWDLLHYQIFLIFAWNWCLLPVSVSPLATPAEWPGALSLWLGSIDQCYAQGIHHHHLLNVASLLLSIDSMFEKANLHISIIIQLVPGVNGLLTNAIGM